MARPIARELRALVSTLSIRTAAACQPESVKERSASATTVDFPEPARPSTITTRVEWCRIRSTSRPASGRCARAVAGDRPDTLARCRLTVRWRAETVFLSPAMSRRFKPCAARWSQICCAFSVCWRLVSRKPRTSLTTRSGGSEYSNSYVVPTRRWRLSAGWCSTVTRRRNPHESSSEVFQTWATFWSSPT